MIMYDTRIPLVIPRHADRAVPLFAIEYIHIRENIKYSPSRNNARFTLQATKIMREIRATSPQWTRSFNELMLL